MTNNISPKGVREIKSDIIQELEDQIAHVEFLKINGYSTDDVDETMQRALDEIVRLRSGPNVLTKSEYVALEIYKSNIENVAPGTPYTILAEGAVETARVRNMRNKNDSIA